MSLNLLFHSLFSLVVLPILFPQLTQHSILSLLSICQVCVCRQSLLMGSVLLNDCLIIDRLIGLTLFPVVSSRRHTVYPTFTFLTTLIPFLVMMKLKSVYVCVADGCLILLTQTPPSVLAYTPTHTICNAASVWFVRFTTCSYC